MEKELKDKWLGALRSGEFAQTTGTLRRDNAYCCLGVLLSVSGKGTWDAQFYEMDEEGAKLKGALGSVGVSIFGIPHDIQYKLVSMNDNEKRTFAEIADYIETAL